MATMDSSLNGEDDFRRFVLREAWDYTTLSNCPDKQLGALLVKGGRIIGRGANLCAPPGATYESKISFCPRLKAKRGTQRKKCLGFHAEVFACLAATSKGITPKDYARFAWHQFDGEKQGARTRRVLQRRFTEAERERIRGAELYLVGVAWVYDACKWLLEWLEITIHENNVVHQHISPDELTRRIENAAQGGNLA